MIGIDRFMDLGKLNMMMVVVVKSFSTILTRNVIFRFLESNYLNSKAKLEIKKV